MKKVKGLLLLSCILLVSGCSAARPVVRQEEVVETRTQETVAENGVEGSTQVEPYLSTTAFAESKDEASQAQAEAKTDAASQAETSADRSVDKQKEQTQASQDQVSENQVEANKDKEAKDTQAPDTDSQAQADQYTQAQTDQKPQDQTDKDTQNRTEQHTPEDPKNLEDAPEEPAAAAEQKLPDTNSAATQSSTPDTQAKTDSSTNAYETMKDEPKTSRYIPLDYYPFLPDTATFYENSQGDEITSLLQFYTRQKDTLKGQIKNYNKDEDSYSSDLVVITDQEVRRQTFDNVGKYRENITGKTLIQPDVIIKAPLTEGETWSSNGTDYKIVAVDKEVQFERGRAFQLEIEAKNSVGSFLMKYQLTRGLVEIRRYDNGVPGEVTYSLADQNYNFEESYNTTFYYPINGQELATIEKELNFHTNESVKDLIMSGYQSLYKNGSIGQVLPGEDAIISLRVEEDTVLVDLRESFVEAMNEKPKLEEATIQSLVNTLCGFYEVNSLRLSVNGQRYESKQKVIEPSDVLKATP